MKFFPRQCSLGLDEVRKPREMQKAGQVAEGSDGGRIRKKSENYAKCQIMQSAEFFTLFSYALCKGSYFAQICTLNSFALCVV